MATKTTIEMAREAAGDDWGLFQEYMPEIHRLVELVRADERARMATKQTEAMKLALEALQEVYWSSRSAKHDEAITALEALAEPEFFTHCVDQPYDWSEWVCPDPKSYLFKCCDCGLVHEAEFGVVRYKSETEREECDMVNDPNLQAVFRMRRSEQWSPADMAHRAGGLTMEQPAQQEPLAWVNQANLNSAAIQRNKGGQGDTHTWSETPTWDHSVPLYTSPPAQRKPLTDKQILADETLRYYFGQNGGAGPVSKQGRKVVDAIEAAHNIK